MKYIDSSLSAALMTTVGDLHIRNKVLTNKSMTPWLELENAGSLFKIFIYGI